MSRPFVPPLQVHWRFARHGQRVPPLEEAESWLAPMERARALAFKVDKRRQDWLLGRMNLKALVVELLEARLGVQVAPRDVIVERRVSGAPAIVLATSVTDVPPGMRDPVPLSVSNSHSNGHALAGALWLDQDTCRGRHVAVGVDLELIERRSDGFISDFLTAEEQQWCLAAEGSERDLRANMVWSAKESVLKVLQRGLSADTWWLTCLPTADDDHALAVSPDDPGWACFAARCDARLGADHISFTGRWREQDGFVLTSAVGWTG